MRQIHFRSKGIFFFKGTAEQWAVIAADHEAAHDNWTLRPIAIGTCHHRCIARAQVRYNRPERAAHFKEHGHRWQWGRSAELTCSFIIIAYI